MALPPIISNLPIIKALKSDQAQPQEQAQGKAAEPKQAAGTPQDIVEISEAARQRLAGAGNLSADEEDKAQALAAETRGLLAETDLTLGLDPHFAE